MRIISTLLLLTLGLTLTACGGGGTGAAPDDFTLRYEWRAGSLPPPYHYEYTISVGPDGGGVIVMVPNYPGEGVPEWREEFTLTRAELDGLYQLLTEQGLLSERWREEDQPPVGGSYAWVVVTAGGRQVELPSFVEAGQRPRAEAMYAAIEALVPQATRADLEARRATYVQENGG